MSEGKKPVISWTFNPENAEDMEVWEYINSRNSDRVNVLRSALACAREASDGQFPILERRPRGRRLDPRVEAQRALDKLSPEALQAAREMGLL